MAASPWAGVCTLRDYAILAITFGFVDAHAMRDFAEAQQDKHERRQVHEYKNGKMGA